MGNFAMIFLISRITGHTVAIYNKCLHYGSGQKLITETFDAPVEILSCDLLNDTSVLYWDETSNLNLPKQHNIFELDSNVNYNICKGLIHFNFLYYLDLESLNYLKKEVFCFKELIKKESISFFNSIKKPDKQVVSIHIRRTDHCTLSTEYQHVAIKLFDPAKYSILICSDDINFCREEFKETLKDYDTIFSENSYEVDMHLMTLCDVNVTADSTFGFWGAMLNDSNREMIIPRQLLPSSMNLQEILSPIKKFKILNF
jgi:hypothetical protein